METSCGAVGDDDGAVNATSSAVVVPPRSCVRSPPHPSLKRRDTTRRSPCCDGAFERAAAAAVAAAADLGALPTLTTTPMPTSTSPFDGVFFHGSSARPGESAAPPAPSSEDMDSVAAALEIPELAHHNPSAVASWVAAAIDARVAESEERRERSSLSSASASACSSASAASSSGAEEAEAEAEEGKRRGGGGRDRRRRGGVGSAPLRSCSPSSSTLSSSSPTAAEEKAGDMAKAASEEEREEREREEPPRPPAPPRAGGKEPRRGCCVAAAPPPPPPPPPPPSSSPAPPPSAAAAAPNSGHPPAISRAPSFSSTPYARPRSHLTPFHGAAPPPISLGAYAERLASHLRPSPLAFAHALELVDRLGAADPLAAPAPDTAHRLLLASVAVAAKLTDDRVRRADVVARVGGVPAAELAGLELALLRGVGFRAHVARGELLQRVRELKIKGGGARGGEPAAGAHAAAAHAEETGANG